MELFIGLALELAVSLFLCFFLTKLVSKPTMDGDLELGGVKGKVTRRGARKFKGERKVCDLGTETNLVFDAKPVGVDESGVDLVVGGSEESRGGIVDYADKVTEEIPQKNRSSCENLIEEINKSENLGEIEEDLIKDDVGISNSTEVEVSNCKSDHVVGGLVDEEDDWEGVERTELERVFGYAVVYVGSEGNASKLSSLSSDLKLKLYGLHKVAIEGPCLVPQPMALKLSARAKWNAWQQLGNMSPEAAMEQYIDLLSVSIPSWTDDFQKYGKQDFAAAEASGKLPSETFLSSNQEVLEERECLCVGSSLEAM